MNTHLNYGQAVPGRAVGRGAGIIDTRGLAWILDASELLDERSGWTAKDRLALQAWFRQYLEWLLTSELGTDEQNADNNHGNWYEVQIARYALFVGEPEVARQALQRAKRKIDAQFDSAGRQPEELERTRSLHYSFFNLSALMVLARLGEHLQSDLWTYQNPDGAGIRKGIDFLMPYAEGRKRWAYPTIDAFKLSRVEHMALRLASRAYADETYARVAAGMPVRHGASDFAALLAPADRDHPQRGAHAR
jgi:hypothetical protein